jgi:hypothetical protein
MSKRNRKFFASSATPKKEAEPFRRHSFSPKVTFTGGCVPRIYVTKIAMTKMYHYVDIADGEVGWLGTASELSSGDFLIEDVFLFKQEVASATTEISPEGLSQFATDMLATPDGVAQLNKLRFWGHSHVNMGTSPSGQDEDQMRQFANSGHDWFIRGILNKAARMEFTLYLYDSGITVEDCPWEEVAVVQDGLRAEIEAEFKAKVSEKHCHTYFGKTTAYGCDFEWPPRRAAGFVLGAGKKEDDEDPYDLSDLLNRSGYTVGNPEKK